MAINTRKVVIGGLAAGVVLNLIDFLSNGVVFADRMRADANMFKPGLGDQMAVMDGGAIATYVAMDFVVGLLLVWTYAAIRPRFGPGAKTAVYVAIVFWIFGAITTSGFMHMGIMSSGLWFQYALVWLVNLLLAVLAGGMVYKEDSTA